MLGFFQTNCRLQTAPIHSSASNSLGRYLSATWQFRSISNTTFLFVLVTWPEFAFDNWAERIKWPKRRNISTQSCVVVVLAGGTSDQHDIGIAQSPLPIHSTFQIFHYESINSRYWRRRISSVSYMSLRNKCGRRGVGSGNPRVRWDYRLHRGHSPRYSVLSPYSRVLPQPSLRLPNLF